MTSDVKVKIKLTDLIDDLKCCGNCKYLSLKYEGQCANDDIGTFADPNPEWVCESWEWDGLTKEARK